MQKNSQKKNNLRNIQLKKKLSVIIVTYNSSKYIKRCLSNLTTFNVLLIDNNSKDSTVEIASKFKNVEIIKNKKNIGYGNAANQGIQKLNTEYILLINPDITINENNIKKMVYFMEKHKECDVQGPKLFYDTENSDNKNISTNNKKLIYSCKRFPTLKSMIGRRLFPTLFKKDVDFYLMKDFNHNVPLKVDWVSGGCMMFRNKKKQFFDKRFFLYFEDVDFCVGKNVYYNPNAVAYHSVQRMSMKNIFYLMHHISSMIKFFFKHKFKINKTNK